MNRLKSSRKTLTSMNALGPSTLASGRADSGMAMAVWNGKMERSMKDIGLWEGHTVMEYSRTLRARSTMVTGAMIRLMEMAHILTQTELNIKVNGSRTCSMAWAKRPGQTGQSSMEHIVTVKRTVSVITNGLMALSTRVSGSITR